MPIQKVREELVFFEFQILLRKLEEEDAEVICHLPLNALKPGVHPIDAAGTDDQDDLDGYHLPLPYHNCP